MSFLQFVDKIGESFCLWIMCFGTPLVALYHALTSNVFINTAAENAEGLERVGNFLLIPTQYLLAGNVAVVSQVNQDPNYPYRYVLEQRFDYEDGWMGLKTAGSLLALPFSFTLGCTCKGIGYLLDTKVQKRQQMIVHSLSSPDGIHSLKSYYDHVGMKMVNLDEAEWMQPLGCSRRPGDETNLSLDKEALKEVARLLNKYEIPFWLDCGSCLGAYRYGGVIPWDFDIDIAVLQPDFDNIRIALSELDPKKYVLQDWSGRDKPKTYLKVYVRETGRLIDLYHFEIDPKHKTIQSILSNENSIFLTEGWKIRERRFIIPTAFEDVFPLKKVSFDGVMVFVPNQTEKYLKQRYGQDISPPKVFNPITQAYEKDYNHPYWQLPHAH